MKLTLVVVEQGRPRDGPVACTGGEQGTALNQSTMPVPAHARRATRTLFSAIIPPFLPCSLWLCYTPGLSNVTYNVGP